MDGMNDTGRYVEQIPWLGHHRLFSDTDVQATRGNGQVFVRSMDEPVPLLARPIRHSMEGVSLLYPIGSATSPLLDFWQLPTPPGFLLRRAGWCDWFPE